MYISEEVRQEVMKTRRALENIHIVLVPELYKAPEDECVELSVQPISENKHSFKERLVGILNSIKSRFGGNCEIGYDW